VKGLTLSVHTDWETLGEMGEMLIMMCSSFVSVAVADVPDSPVVISGERTATLTDLLSLLCFSQHVCPDAVHRCLHDRGGVLAVHEDAVSGCDEWCFVHVLIIGH